MKAHDYSFCPECGHKLEGDEYLCPSCGFKLAEQPPVAPPPVSEPVAPAAPPADEFVPPVPPVTPPVNEVPPVAPPVMPPVAPPAPEPVPVTPPVTPPLSQQEPLSYQPAPQQPMATPKKKKRLGLKIIIIVLVVLVVGGGVGAFLIYNGTIPKDKVSFLPKEVLEMLTPADKKSSSETKIHAKAYYVTYSFALVDNKKIAIISSVMDPSNSEKSNEKGAESAFLEFARINYSKDYFHFTANMRTKKFDDREKAVQERENLKKEYQNKGYELRLMEVQYSVN